MERIDMKSMMTGAIVFLSTVWWAIAQEHKSILAQALTTKPNTNNTVTQYSPSENKESHSKYYYTIWPIVEGECISARRAMLTFSHFFALKDDQKWYK